MISFLIQQKVNQDGPTADTNYTNFTLVRKLDTVPFPLDFRARARQEKNITAFETERQLLEAFINKLHQFDPDLLIAHNLCGSVIEILLNRINMLRIGHWSRIGRMKRSNMPQRKNDGSASSWVPR